MWYICFPTLGRRGPRHGRLALVTLALAIGVPVAAAAGRPAAPATPDQGVRLPAPDTGVLQSTSSGTVRGFVIDAETQRPVAGARLRIEENGVFATEGRTVALTDSAGRFDTKARIGRSWKKIDWMRVITSFPPLLLLRPDSALKQSRTILATRLNVRVEREGYLPFVGEVRCSRLDAGKFAVHLDDIWLAPAGSGLASFSPDNVQYERVASFVVEPAVALPGEQVTVTARVRIPFERGGRYRVYFDSSAPALVRSEQRLEAAGPPDPATGVTTFRRVVRLPRTPKARTTELSPWISLDYEELPVGWEFKALLQVIDEETEREAAAKVTAAHAHLVKNDLGAAAALLRQAAASHPRYTPAYRYLGEVNEALGRTEEAAQAYETLVALAPEDVEVAWARYAEALLEGGRTETLAQALETIEKRSKRLPAALSLARARLLARRGDLRAADEQLARAGRRGRIPHRVQREIALRRAEAALRAEPESADAELALARALAEVDRPEEAARHARRAHTLRPDEPWPLVELASLERRRGHTAVARTALERALTLDPGNGDAHLALGELLLADGEPARAREHFRRAAERRPFDFAARHGLALAELQAGAREAALRELRVAAVLGRGKGVIDGGFAVPMGPITTLYLGPKRQKIAGFDRREAAEDLQLARALEALQQRPEEALAHLNAGTALVRLGQSELGLAFLDRAAGLDAGLADLAFWRGLALLGLQRAPEARAALEAALRQNPRHSYTHRVLARLCLADGDLEQAQAHLAAHRRHWPHERDTTLGVIHE